MRRGMLKRAITPTSENQMNFAIKYLESSLVSCIKLQYSRAPFQKIADIVVAFRNEMKRLADNLLLNIFSLQHTTQQVSNVSFNKLHANKHNTGIEQSML